MCEALDLRDAVFVGPSVSAMIGVLAAGMAPERIAALVMVAPSPRYIDDDGYRGGFSADGIEELLESLEANFLGWSAAMAPVIMGNPEQPELGEELKNSFCATDPDMARIFARTNFLSDSRRDLKSVRVPTLVLECPQDVIAPREVGAFVHQETPARRWSPWRRPGIARICPLPRRPMMRSRVSWQICADVPPRPAAGAAGHRPRYWRTSPTSCKCAQCG